MSTSCWDGKSHEIASVEIERLPPADDGDLRYLAEKMLDHSDTMFSAEDIAKVAESLTKKRFLVYCKKCGMVVGGCSDIQPGGLADVASGSLPLKTK